MTPQLRVFYLESVLRCIYTRTYSWIRSMTMAPKRVTAFNEGHVLAYGLTVCERDASTMTVVSVSCQFCLHFGRA